MAKHCEGFCTGIVVTEGLTGMAVLASLLPDTEVPLPEPLLPEAVPEELEVSDDPADPDVPESEPEEPDEPEEPLSFEPEELSPLFSFPFSLLSLEVLLLLDCPPASAEGASAGVTVGWASNTLLGEVWGSGVALMPLIWAAVNEP